MPNLRPWQWRVVRRLFDRFRRAVATVDVDERHLVVDAPVEDVRRVLGRSHFTNAWELSYSYEGEVLNMRRPVYIVGSERPWQQDHVRGFRRTRETTELVAHRELEPTEYPHGHLAEESYRETPAVAVVRDILKDEGLTVEEVAP